MAYLTNEELRERLFWAGYNVPISINRAFYLKFLTAKEKELGIQVPVQKRTIPGAGGDSAREGMDHVPPRMEDRDWADVDIAPALKEESNVANAAPERRREPEVENPLRGWTTQAKAANAAMQQMREAEVAHARPMSPGEPSDESFVCGSDGDFPIEEIQGSPFFSEETLKDGPALRFTLPCKSSSANGFSMPTKDTSSKYWIVRHPTISSIMGFTLVVGIGVAWIWMEIERLMQSEDFLYYASVTMSIAAMILIWKVLQIYKASQKKEEEELFALVEKVVEFLRKQHEISLQSEGVPSFLAVSHIRDELLSPRERTSKTKVAIWNKVVDHVALYESRIREEIKDIDGMDFKTWRWFPTLNGNSPVASR